MQIFINDQTVTIPTTLAEFTLGQRIDFQNLHGEELTAMAVSIDAMEEGMEKELEMMQYQIEKMVHTFAFFSGFEPEAIRESEYIDDMAAIYYASIAALFEEEDTISLQREFVWRNEVWELHPPELKHGSKMKTGEYVDVKQMLLNMEALSKGRWESMLFLCAVYLRRQGEEYHESFLYDGSERITLMRDLPMSIALQVGFFLTRLTNTYINTSASSRKAGLRVLANGVLSTLSNMAG